VFVALWLGTQTPLPLISGISRSFIEASGTPGGLLLVAGIGFAICAVATVAFARIGDARNLDKNRT
jgi:hypothetical protein